jgi:hypothetical protein
MGKPRVNRQALLNRRSVPPRALARVWRPFLLVVALAAAGFLAGPFVTRPLYAETAAAPQGPTAAAGEQTATASGGSLVPADSGRLDQQQLATAIDDYFVRYWKQNGIEPAVAADDAEFLRRASLDLVGKIPSVSQARAFLDSANPDKRAELVDALLQEGACATHFANLWRATLLGGAADDQQTRALTPRLETWLTLRFTANMPYDQLVRELLLAPVAKGAQPQLGADGVADPAAFYQASSGKPEQLAASTSRVFLGLQVQCAECHDHPHRHWKQREFWSYAAFFTNLSGQQAAAEDADEQRADDENLEEPAAAASPTGGLKIPHTDIVALPVFLDGSTTAAAAGGPRRVALVHWLTGRDNRWFAQAAANRLWEQLLGRGLVDPAEDLEAAGPNDHAELLAFVAGQFAAHDYDIRYLLRALAGTRLYQFSSRTSPSSPLERHYFARMPLRRMTGEQLVDSLIQATGLREPPAARNQPLGDDSLRAEFRQKFSEANVARTEGETTILQALSLMNGKLVAGAIDLAQGETLAAVVDAPFLDSQAKVEVLFLATLSRRPSADEGRQFVEYVESGGLKHDRAAALADVCWALLNSAEFVLVR